MIPPKLNKDNKNVFFHLPVLEVQKKFRRIGYKIDIETSYYEIYRNSNFPFQRVCLPKAGIMTLFSLKHILDAIPMKYEEFKRI